MSTPVDFATLAANDNQVVLTALIEFVWAATAVGIAIGLYPVYFGEDYVLYRARLIPRWLSGWGLVAIGLP